VSVNSVNPDETIPVGRKFKAYDLVASIMAGTAPRLHAGYLHKGLFGDYNAA
jgi:hypothetical protein